MTGTAGSGALEVCALASGSSGNATLIRAGGFSLLIDAGLPARALTQAIGKRGVEAGTLTAVLLTHEHTDHSLSAGAVSRRTRTPVYASAGTLGALADREEQSFDGHELNPGQEVTIGPFGIRSFAVPHDARQPAGFVIDHGATRIAYCTDVGSVTEEVRVALKGANLAVVEANHDLNWLQRGPYTLEMKARVASPTGHLSNDDCADLLAERLESGGPLTIWLAHLSRVNNSPSLARRSVIERISKQSRTPFILHVALRDHPSVVWRAGAQSVQLALMAYDND